MRHRVRVYPGVVPPGIAGSVVSSQILWYLEPRFRSSPQMKLQGARLFLVFVLLPVWAINIYGRLMTNSVRDRSAGHRYHE